MMCIAAAVAGVVTQMLGTENGRLASQGKLEHQEKSPCEPKRYRVQQVTSSTRNPS
jgi:hypothetical protein